MLRLQESLRSFMALKYNFTQHYSQNPGGGGMVDGKGASVHVEQVAEVGTAWRGEGSLKTLMQVMIVLEGAVDLYSDYHGGQHATRLLAQSFLSKCSRRMS